MSDYAGRFQSAEAAAKYDVGEYAPGGYAAHVHALETAWLRKFVRSRFAGHLPVHIDYACGTGRILLELADVVAEAHGYDAAQAMLDRAAERGVRAHLHAVEVGGTPPSPPDPGGRPVLVTIFRLLLNADPATREAAIAFATAALELAPDGVLIVNNHGNRRSLRQLARLWRGPNVVSLRDRDVRRLLQAHGLRVIERRGFGLVPQTAYRSRVTARLARALNAAASRLPLDAVSIDQVYAAELSR